MFALILNHATLEHNEAEVDLKSFDLINVDQILHVHIVVAISRIWVCYIILYNFASSINVRIQSLQKYTPSPQFERLTESSELHKLLSLQYSSVFNRLLCTSLKLPHLSPAKFSITFWKTNNELPCLRFLNSLLHRILNTRKIVTLESK